jgi:GTPase SAR1 family protein
LCSGREALRAEETKRELEMQKLDNFAQREIISLVTDLPPPATSNMSVAMRSAAHDVLAQEFKPSVEKVIDAKVTREELLTQLSALDVSATSHVPAVATTSAFALKNSPTAQLLQAALPDLKQKIQQILSDDRQKFEVPSLLVLCFQLKSLFYNFPLIRNP